MSIIYLFNKPFQVLSQFTDNQQRTTLANFIDTSHVYPAGRLDYDSEGLLVLTGDGAIQARIADPKHKLEKTYWVQVEGAIQATSLEQLQKGVELKDGLTKPAKAKKIQPPHIWERSPPIRQRENDCTSWIEISISEGKNRQVRRMTAAVGHPTLRLIRYSIGNWTIDNIKPGETKKLEVHLPSNIPRKGKHHPPHSNRNKKHSKR